jgi:hypothetical protein
MSWPTGLHTVGQPAERFPTEWAPYYGEEGKWRLFEVQLPGDAKAIADPGEPAAEAIRVERHEDIAAFSEGGR